MFISAILLAMTVVLSVPCPSTHPFLPLIQHSPLLCPTLKKGKPSHGPTHPPQGCLLLLRSPSDGRSGGSRRGGHRPPAALRPFVCPICSASFSLSSIPLFLSFSTSTFSSSHSSSPPSRPMPSQTLACRPGWDEWIAGDNYRVSRG